MLGAALTLLVWLLRLQAVALLCLDFYFHVTIGAPELAAERDAMLLVGSVVRGLTLPLLLIASAQIIEMMRRQRTQ